MFVIFAIQLQLIIYEELILCIFYFNWPIFNFETTTTRDGEITIYSFCAGMGGRWRLREEVIVIILLHVAEVPFCCLLRSAYGPTVSGYVFQI
jgi:hypothetical protein